MAVLIFDNSFPVFLDVDNCVKASKSFFFCHNFDLLAISC